ncbi:MAG: aldo/keto reductase [Chloroflexi bacterium]|nr:MAG: aldo/keto reductase [Chloroflexota bacterium]
MEYRLLGRSGLRVSAIGLGGNTFGGAGCDAQQTAAIVDRALELGINHFDCADTYGAGGGSERNLGAALAGRRDDAIVATKTGFPLGSGPNADGLSRRRIINNCEASLKRLGMDYVDIFYLHRPDPRTDIDESLDALNDLVRQGKVRYAACSNYSGWEIARMVERAQRHGWAAPVVSQSRYSVLSREVELDVVPATLAYGMSIVPYSPLAGGLLTGKYRAGEPPPAGTRAARSARMQELLNNAGMAVVERLLAFARERGHTGGDLALAWLLAQPTVCSVIAGVTSPEQVSANVAALDWKLSAEELAEIDAIVADWPAGLDT